MDIPTRNIEEPQQTYRLGTVRSRLLGKLGVIHVLLAQASPCASVVLNTFGPHECFLIQQ